MIQKLSLLLLTVLMGAGLATAQDRPVAFTGATVYPISSPPIENGVVVVHNGVITAVGDAGTRIPSDAERVDATGKIIMPGLVDTHSHIGGRRRW